MKIDNRAVGMYEDDLFTLEMIGEFFGVTRQAAKKFLNKRGIDTSKKKFMVVCDGCGIEFGKYRSQIRKCVKNYCCVECFYNDIHNPDYIEHRNGTRVARRIVLNCGYRMGESEIPHHKDGDQDNNDPNNLIVFKNHSEHMRWHRAGLEESGVIPIWPFDLRDRLIEKHSRILDKKEEINQKRINGSKKVVIEETKSKIAEIVKKPKFSQKYKDKNPSERCSDCGKALKFCGC